MLTTEAADDGGSVRPLLGILLSSPTSSLVRDMRHLAGGDQSERKKTLDGPTAADTLSSSNVFFLAWWGFVFFVEYHDTNGKHTDCRGILMNTA